MSEDEEDEEDENEVPCDLHHTISHPNGEAGWGGDSGRGFNIQKLIGLSEDRARYNAIMVRLISFNDLFF